MRQTPDGKRAWATVGLVVALALAIGLRAVQYLGEVPLWHDEAAW